MRYLTPFLDFIVESLQEAPLVFNTSFTEKLKRLKSPLATDLLALIGEPAGFTLLTAMVDGNYISYLPADKFLAKVGAERDWDNLVKITPLLIDELGPDNFKGFVQTKTGRVFKKLLPAASDAQIETLVNEYKSLFTPPKFEVWEGDNLINGYRSTNYNETGPSSNSLMNSCMNDQLDLVAFYKHCPVRLLVLLDPLNHILGRALIWTFTEGIFMDRVYTIHEADVHHFTRYAQEQKWWWKEVNKSGPSIEYTNGNVVKWFPIQFTIVSCQLYKNPYQDEYSDLPYLDTFWYYYGTTLTNTIPKKEEYYLQLTDTDGYPEIIRDNIFDVHGEVVDDPEEYTWSSTQGGLIHYDTAIHVDYSKLDDMVELSYLENPQNGFIQAPDQSWYLASDCQKLPNGEIRYPKK